MKLFWECATYPRMFARAVGAILAVCFLLERCDGLPITGCPPYKGNFYLADHSNGCVYYWCVSGVLQGGGRRCPPGAGVPRFHRSNRNPCQLTVRSCIRSAQNAAGMDRSTPVPSPPPVTTAAEKVETMETTYAVTMTAMEEVTTQQEPDMTTPQEPDMTTQQEPDMTTHQEPDMTTEIEDDDGSGDEDFLPVDDDDTDSQGGASGDLYVYSDSQADGGLKLPLIQTFPECLDTCSLLSQLCEALEWYQDSCYIHTPSTACNSLQSLDGSVHIRFKAC